MLNVVRVEFSKLRRWKLLRVLPMLSLVLPAITFSYFATHPDYLTDMGLYKQALFSFNIFLILPAILGVLASMLVYNEQRCDVLKQLWIIPVSKGGYLFAKWVVILTVSLAFMMLAVGFTFAFGLAFGFLSWNGEMMAFILYKGIEAAVLEAVAVIPILALAVSHKGYLLPCCAAIIYAFLALDCDEYHHLIIGFREIAKTVVSEMGSPCGSCDTSHSEWRILHCCNGLLCLFLRFNIRHKDSIHAGIE